MKKTSWLLALTLAATSAAFAQSSDNAGAPPGPGQGYQGNPGADDQGGPPVPGGPGGPGGFRHHHRPPPLPLVEALDVNHDGIIDANEIANASAELKTLDKNGDGQLTRDEYMPPPPPGVSEEDFHPPIPPIVAALDVNHDGIIDANEIANAPAALKTLDKNGDGQLTRDEFCPPPPGAPGADNGAPPPPPDGASSDAQPPQPKQ